MRILYVEDNEDNVFVLRSRLTRAGHEVLIACNGAEGLTLAQSAKPDLILMDLSLPVMDGWTATRHLKSDLATKDIPVIALSAHAMTGDREKALEAGCDDYDTKPIDLARLKAKIQALTSGRDDQ